MPHTTQGPIKLYYEIHGEGTEYVTFLGGLTMATASWQHQVRALAPYFKVLLVDMRGQGQSDRPEATIYPLEQQADDVVTLLDELGIEKTHLVGLSYGGVVSQYFALRHPGRLRRLMLADTLAYSDHVNEAVARSWDEAEQLGGPILRFRVSVPLIFGERFMVAAKDLFPAIEQGSLNQSWPTIRAMVAGILVHDARERLHEIQAETLVVVGDEDRFTPLHHARAIGERIPNSLFRILHGVGHASPLEDPPQFNSVMVPFLKGDPVDDVVKLEPGHKLTVTFEVNE